MIVRARFQDVHSSITPKWVLFEVPERTTIFEMFDLIHSQEIKPNVDLSWCDIDSLKAFTAVVRKSVPGNADLQETSNTVRLCDIAMTEHRIFVHFELLT